MFEPLNGIYLRISLAKSIGIKTFICIVCIHFKFNEVLLLVQKAQSLDDCCMVSVKKQIWAVLTSSGVGGQPQIPQ